MNVPSDEQKHILFELEKGHNVYVQAVAGSGKTTTVFWICKHFPNKKVLQLTYNSSLRLETRDRAKQMDISNVSIHTFHSLGKKYYSNNAHTDTGLREILLYKYKPLKKINDFDILVIDENQDLTQLYYMFIIKFLLDYKTPIQLICLGDERQCIYQFKGADPRFLSLCSNLWESFIYLKSKIFVKCDLKTSYRITNQMGMFINKCLYGEKIVNTCRDGANVIYIRNNRSNIEATVIYNIKKLLNQDIKPDEIFILAASVKGANSHIRKIENKLVEENIPCFVPMMETEKLDERVIEGKIVFSTFHSVKGRQRKYVFFVGFDNNYFFQFARDYERTICPNTVYVGTSRATNQLFLIEYNHFPSDRPFEFMKTTHHDMIKCDFIDFKGIPGSLFQNSDELLINNNKHFESPTKIVQFIGEEVLYKITPIIDRIYIQTSEANNPIDIPSIIETDCGYEDVSDLNGIAIPFLFYEKMSQNNLLNNMIDQQTNNIYQTEHKFLFDLIKEIPEKCNTINDYLFMANIYVSLQEKLYFKLKQIHKSQYGWLSYTIITQCLRRLETMIDVSNKESLIFEKTIIQTSDEDAHKKIDNILKKYFCDKEFRFSAIVDVINQDNIYEIKCTSSITIEHKIQLIFYAFIWKALEMPEKKFLLVNIKSGESFELLASLEDVTCVIVEILRGKYEKKEYNNNIHFIENNIYNMNVLTSIHLMDSFIDQMDDYSLERK